MVRGLDLFRERFRDFEGCFVLIGGAACDQWFTSQNLTFRPTKDLDLVLLIEVLDQAFVTAMRSFVEEGGYEISQRSDGSPELYRFAKPTNDAFPAEMELFSRSPSGLDWAPGEIIPLDIEADHHSLSAILLDEAYYRLIRTHYDVADGLGVANATSLIPLKARAWLDLTRRKAAGEPIDSKKINKHRTDVFRLASTLPGEPGPELADSVKADLASFLRAFPGESTEWPSILDSLKATLGGNPRSSSLRSAIQTYFRLPAE